MVGGILGTVGFTSIAGVSIASAETTTSGSSDPMSSLVQKLATKFNLDKDEVQKVFDENKTAHQAEREQKIAERLQKLVDAGTITTTQKTAIENKLKELRQEHKADRETMKDLNDSERQSKIDEKRSELESWAKEQGIDLSKIKGIFGGPGGRH